MNVPKRCLGTQTRPDKLRGEPRQGEPFHALTPLAPTRADFSEISSQELQRSGSVSTLQMPRMDASRR